MAKYLKFTTETANVRMGKGGRTMRKRRVLAVLLALSLVVSGNGMTVLAAEEGAEQPVVTIQEEMPETSEEPEETEVPVTTEKPEESETPGTTQEPTESEMPGTSEKPEEAQELATSENPEETETPGAAEEPSETEAPVKLEESTATAHEKEEPVEEPVEAVSTDKNYVSRIVTFTDDTGMKVAYDANASAQYVYKVEDGVLTAVVTQTTVSDNTIEEPVAFTGNVELRQPEAGEKYTSIANGVFGGNQNITYVKLPMGLETIGTEAFKGCTALKGVYLPASVNKIENSAFENCTAMTQISVPKAVTSIGDAAFKGDMRLYLVYMKDVDYSELKSIGAEAFSGCVVLSQLCGHSDFVFPTRLETVGVSAFQDCRAIKKIDFSANKKLTAIGAHAFAGCTGLTDLTPGKTLTEIPEGAFAGCTALACINFENGKPMTLGREAFKGCYNLKQLVLPQSVAVIREYTFQGCTKLTQVEIRNYNIEIEPKAFPDRKDLLIVAEKDSNGYNYALENGFQIPDEDAFYQYAVEDVDGVSIEDGKFPGGTVWVGTASSTKPDDQQNINLQNKGKGVKSGELCYVYHEQTEEQTKNYTFISSSLRCNGKTMQKKDGKYYFEMPAGGAVITAEFRANTPDKIKGQQVTVEFSNGTPLQNGLTDQYGYLGVELRVGQTSRMFLLDEDGTPISTTKLVAVRSDNEKVAKIDKKGVITAVGTEGQEKADATVTVEVISGDGSKITINRTVSVTMAEAESIILKPSDYSTLVKIGGEPDGIQTASIKKNIVRAEGLSFKLKACVYDGEEGISKELTWTTSDPKVATLKEDKTTAEKPVNEVFVQKGCEGEATITVTAQNPADSAQEKITQKFVVRVYEEGFRLTSSTVTVNPRMSEGSTIELISAYGIGLENATIELYEEQTTGSTKFTAEYDEKESSDVCKRFRIRPISDTIKDGTYKIRVGVNGDRDEKSLMPLTITVKAGTPNPTVKFNANKAKFNLFYKNGGTTTEGAPISVVTEITKLGGAKVTEAKLEPLTQKEDDKLFTENFEIDNDNTDLAKGKVAIKRTGNALRYTKQKKAAVTGYLVLYFGGYDNSAAKKVKVTLPTCTTAPSWALRTTKATYRANAYMQDVSLALYDKKSKTKEQVVLNDDYTLTEENGDLALEGSPRIEDGVIRVKFWPDKGKLKLVLHNPNWEQDQNGRERTLSYVYNVSISNAKPTVKTDQSFVTLNRNYPESEAQFSLVSNPVGLDIEPKQDFSPVVTDSNAAEINKLRVTYENGGGRVIIKEGQSVAKGTYKFECYPKAGESGLKKTILTVKVVDNKPTVKFDKGSLQLNKVVYDNNSTAMNKVEGDAVAAKAVLYQEISEVTFKVSGKPEGYTLAPVGSGAGETKIESVESYGVENYFAFSVEEDLTQKKGDALRVTLRNGAIAEGIYKFMMTPRYLKEGLATVSAKPVTFSVKVISTDNIYMTASAKGKINLLNREGESNDKNGIVYTPALKNIAGEIEDVKIYDASSLKEESNLFDIRMIEEGKDAGKLFVTPKKMAKTPQNPGDPIEYTYAELENNKSYAVRIWVQVKGYAGSAKTMGGVLSETIRIKTGQILPKVTTDKTSLDVFLSTKNYNASFVVKAKEGSVGIVEEVYFAEMDEMANDSFKLIQTPQADGSLKVTVHLKEAVRFSNGTVNNVKFYVKYKGQGTNTSETATGFTMKIKVN